MQQDFTVQKRAILTVLAVLVAADIALAVYSYQLASAPFTSDRQFEAQNLKLKALRGDIKSAQDIKTDMPKTRQDCEKFEQSLPLLAVGSSSMTSDLDEIAQKSGLQIVTFTAKPKEIEHRGVIQEEIDLTVGGDYNSVARFVNGLQRLPKFYIMDALALSTETQKGANGALRVALHLRTYFREAA
jgi:Tfp pilus assembly protein PilO